MNSVNDDSYSAAKYPDFVKTASDAKPHQNSSKNKIYFFLRTTGIQQETISLTTTTKKRYQTFGTVEGDSRISKLNARRKGQ
jgi:hypothetical protein